MNEEEFVLAMGRDVYAVDTGYVRPRLDASHIIVSNGRAAFVDTGTSHSVPRLLAALDYLEIDLNRVDYVFLTHIHLDHAGGAGKLMAALPRATLAVHPRGARHMVDPARLIAGTRAVYGDKEYERLYGEILPVPEDRVREIADGDRIELGGRSLEFIHTRGHANHHYCIVDEAASSVFTGDSFGVSYRETDTAQGAFIIPTTTPVHFDLPAAHESIDRIMSYQPEAVFLTHFGRLDGPARLAECLHRDLDAFAELAMSARDSEDRARAIADAMRAYLWARLDEHGFRNEEHEREDILGMDIELNSMGLDVWLSRMSTS